MAGAFAELSLGLGVNRLGLAGRPATWSSQLLGRFAFGAYLAGPDGPAGELALYYDHRHDDWAGGLAFDTVSDGVLGHVGLRAEYWLDQRWGLNVELAAGSAVFCALGLAYAWEAR